MSIFKIKKTAFTIGVIFMSKNILFFIIVNCILLSGCYKPNPVTPSTGSPTNTASTVSNNSNINKNIEDKEEPISDNSLSDNKISRNILNTKHHLYVSTSGNDENNGTKDKPFKTIVKASKVAQPDTTIHVAPGIYEGGFQTTANGIVSNPILYVSDVKYGAKIKGFNTNNDTLWDNRGNYTYINGFEFDGKGALPVTVGIFLGGSFSKAENNYVHHIATERPCSSKGSAGIKTDNYFGGVYIDVLNNKIHDIGSNNCNFDQGIYLSTSGTAHNNLVYGIASTGISSWHNATNLTITNNTVFGNQFGIIIGGGDFYNGFTKPNDFSVVANNIVYDNSRNGIDEQGKTGTNNLYMNNLSYKNGENNWSLQNGNIHTDSIEKDPEFVQYNRLGNGDYKLKQNSPAIDSGKTGAWNPLTDIDEKKRVQGKGIDLGAYEYGNELPDGVNNDPNNVNPTLPNPTTPIGGSTDIPISPETPVIPKPIPKPEVPEPLPVPTIPSDNGYPDTVTSSNNLYVSPNGSDSNLGTKEAPFRTIQKAASKAIADTTVHVAAGSYKENIRTTAHGTSIARIRYISEPKWGAKIISSGTETAWFNNGNYTDIIGFDITGTVRLGILNNASNTTMSHNYVHNLTVSGGCNGGGGAGINNGNYSASDNDIFNNIVHDIGVPGSCNKVQGIYHSNLRGHIYNNIVYRVAGFGIHLWHAANNVMINNNTIFNNGSSQVGGGVLLGNGDKPGGIVLDNTNFINNIVYDNPGYSIIEYCYAGENCIGKNNIVANNLIYKNGKQIILKATKDTNTINNDPQFINYEPNGNGNYNLKPSSPAIINSQKLGALP